MANLTGWDLNRYGEYSLIYGSLGVGIALLIWIYLVSFIVLAGAEFNVLLFPRTVARRPAAVEIPRPRAAS